MLLSVLAGMLAGCQGLTAEHRRWLAEGERAYQQRQYEQAIGQLSQFIPAASGRPEAARALYVRGMAYARSNQRIQARSDLSRCLEQTQDADLRWRAYAVLGTLDYEDGQWSAAARAYSSAAQIAPPAPPTDTILFRLGVCQERCRRWAAAREPYERLMRDFPTSAWADAARRRLAIKADHFAVQCGVFAAQENAERLAADLKRQGLSPYIQREQRGQSRVYVVLVGRYDGYEEALSALAEIKGYVADAVLWP